jgi:uncharacterized sporulation protein YeaH/YhbH (DUF444 family)
MPALEDEKVDAQLKAAGLEPAPEARIRCELEAGGSHDLPDPGRADAGAGFGRDLYAFHDLDGVQRFTAMHSSASANIRSIDELLERDKQREADGFPRRIDVGRLIKPGKSGKQKVVIVPTTVEEKFLHDTSFRTEEEHSTGGSGDGEEGEVIGEQPVRAPDGAAGTGPGQGEDGQHEVESSAYDLGRILTEKFQLPNLKEKGKKRSLTRYTYDLTDRHRGFGQLLDKKATLRRIVETNIHLGNLADVSHIDPARFLVAPADKVYRILSREKDYESQAMVFFLRDYSGSMEGNSTQLVVAQHVLIYSWLLYQYAMQVETRFILHDTRAAEVPDFYTYYNSKVAGGTQVSSAYTLVNQIVQKESLARDYNIYIFHGTDGDDWDAEGKESLPQLNIMLTYASRVGITIAKHGPPEGAPSEVERYIQKSGLLEGKPRLIRLDVMQDDAGEPRVIEGIKKLISE